MFAFYLCLRKANNQAGALIIRNMPKGIPKNGINKGWFKKGCMPWDKGMKVEDDERVKRFCNAGHKALKGKSSWNKGIKMWKNKKHPFLGKHHTEKVKKKMSKFNKGKNMAEKNSQWKGDNVGYQCLHAWVYRYKGEPKQCEFCDTTNKEKRLTWASKSREYRRDLDDWIALCYSCHMKYDIRKQIYSDMIKI